MVNLAVAEKINVPGGGDYAGAIDVLRGLERPEYIQQFQIGMLVIDGFEEAGARRLLFERGAGRAPNAIPVDVKIADH